MAYLKSYKELIVWKKSMKLVKEVFLITGTFPKSEMYGLSSQMRKCAISIPSNIAEGSGRKSIKEYAHFYSIAFGSALELETQAIIARELGFANGNSFSTMDVLLDEVLRMLNVMTSKMKLATRS